ncbi:hypothetical protein RTP6_003227 [Batrachochytrium dendrobatidis]
MVTISHFISPFSSPLSLAVTHQMIIVLAAGVSTVLLNQVDESLCHFQHSYLLGLPKGLFPISSTPSLSWCYQFFSKQSDIHDRVYVVASAQSFKPYERWAIDVGLPAGHVLSIGTAELRDPKNAFLDSLGVALRLACAPTNSSDSHTLMGIDQEITIIGSDFLPDQHLLSSWTVLPRHVSVLVSSTGSSLIALKVSAEVVPLLLEYIDLCQMQLWQTKAPCVGSNESTAQPTTTYDQLLAWLDQNGKLSKHILPVDDPISKWMDPAVSLADYHSYWKSFQPNLPRIVAPLSCIPNIHHRVYARIGLMGNPSDGFYGKTISTTISNFWADVTLVPNADSSDSSCCFVANKICDHISFGSIHTAHQVAKIDGYDGASRLLLATIRIFVQYCNTNNIPLVRRGMRIIYQTNIPRQVGLAGSSSLVIALLKSLLKFNSISEATIPLWKQANMALSAETDELGITAGLQDRIVQVYGGCVHMDFDRKLMTNRSFGEYQPLSTSGIPLNLWMAFVRQPKESGKVHHTVKTRFEKGDLDVVEGMKQLGKLADEAKTAMQVNDSFALAQLFDANFALRRQLYGDAVIGVQTLRIIELAHQHGHAAKLSGSGGCVIGIWREKDASKFVAQTRELRSELEREGFIFCFVDIPKTY